MVRGTVVGRTFQPTLPGSESMKIVLVVLLLAAGGFLAKKKLDAQ